jgi:hypothetical protein
MSKKVAKLVRVSLVTRVIVDIDATEQEIMELAVPKLSENLMDSPFDSIDEIVDDTECPYEESEDEDIENYIDVYASVELDTWLRCKEEIMSFSIDGINHHDNESRMTHEDDWNINLRIHREDYASLEKFCNYFETVEVDDDKSDEVYDILCDEYLHSDVTSGEMIYSTTLSLKFSEGDVREGVQTFLDWDDSPETFELERGDKHWIIKCI